MFVLSNTIQAGDSSGKTAAKGREEGWREGKKYIRRNAELCIPHAYHHQEGSTPSATAHHSERKKKAHSKEKQQPY